MQPHNEILCSTKGKQRRYAQAWNNVQDILTVKSEGEKSKFGNNRESLIISVKKASEAYLFINGLLCILHAIKSYRKVWNWEEAAPDYLLKLLPACFLLRS